MNSRLNKNYPHRCRWVSSNLFRVWIRTKRWRENFLSLLELKHPSLFSLDSGTPGFFIYRLSDFTWAYIVDSHDSQAFKFGLNYTIGFSSSPAQWWQSMGLPDLYNFVSQIYISSVSSLKNPLTDIGIEFGASRTEF